MHSDHFEYTFKPGVGWPQASSCLVSSVGRLYMCVSALRLIINSGAIWTPHDWLSKGYSFYMAGVVIISDGCGLRIKVCCRN